MPEPTRFTIVAPHPDDEIIGCGGLAAKWIERGLTGHVIWVSGRDDPEEEAEARAAARALGLAEVTTLGLPGVGLTYDRPALARLVDALRQSAPDVLFIPHADEGDDAHRLSHRLAVEAEWLAAHPWPGASTPPLRARPRLVLEYEVWTPIADPSYVVDVTAWMPTKLDALRHHRRQLEVCRLDRAVEGLGRYRGEMLLGVPYAEAYAVRSCRNLDFGAALAGGA